MLQIPDIIKDLYTRDTVRKNFRVHFPNGELDDIVNDRIVSESLTFTESICSQDSFKMGLSEKPSISFQCHGIGNIKGYRIDCYLEIDTTGYTVDGPMTSDDVPFPFYRITLGRYTVNSCSLNNLGIRSVEGYMDTSPQTNLTIRKLKSLNPVEEAKARCGATNNNPYNISSSAFVYINRAENLMWDEYLSYTTVTPTTTGSTSTTITFPTNTVFDLDGYPVSSVAIEINEYNIGFNDPSIYQADITPGLPPEALNVYRHFLTQLSDDFKNRYANVLALISRGGRTLATIVTDYSGTRKKTATAEVTEEFCAFTFKSNSNKTQGSASDTIHNSFSLPVAFRYIYRVGTSARIKRFTFDARLTKVQGFMDTGTLSFPVTGALDYWDDLTPPAVDFYKPNFSSVDVEGFVSGYTELTCAFDRYDRFSNSVKEFYRYKESDADTYNITPSQIKGTLERVGEKITISGMRVLFNGNLYPYVQGNSPYIVTGNAFTSNDSTYNYGQIVQRYYPRIDGFTYVPMKIDLMGVPFVQCGDRVTFELNGVTYNSIILRRTLKGIQHLTDTFEAFGDY